MNRKIFTLLASALMLFSTALTVNATIKGGNLAVGDTVRTLPDGKGLGMYHIRIDSIRVLENGDYIWRKVGGTTGVGFPQYEVPTNDTVVLGVKDGGLVIPVGINRLRRNFLSKYLDLQSTMWCINIVDDPNRIGQMPTFHFTNKAFDLDLDYEEGGTYVSNDEKKGWMYSYSYDNGQLNYNRPFYRLTDAQDGKYTVLVYENDSIRSKVVSISDFVNKRVANLLMFTIVDVAPVVLTADEFNSRFNEIKPGDGIELGFDPEPNSTAYPNYFARKLFAETSTVDAAADLGYLHVRIDEPEGPRIYNIWHRDGEVNPDRYTNDLGVNHIRILADGKDTTNVSSITDDNSSYRFVYFPSKDSLVINAYAVGHLNHSYYASNKYLDGTVGFGGSIAGGAYKIDGPNSKPIYYGLYNDVIHDALIVRSQDLFGDKSNRLLTIGKSPANTRISFGINNCNMELDGWQPDEGVYTIWDSRGRALGIRIYNGSLVPQWMELDEGECPDRIPSYQWVVEKAKDNIRINITNREFGHLSTTQWSNNFVRIENVLVKKDISYQIFGNQSRFNYDPLRNPWIRYEESIVHGFVTGTYVDPVGPLECIVKAESGFRPVTDAYVADQHLGYKYFYVDTVVSSVSFGKSDDIGPAKGMDYNAFAFNYLHSYSEDSYINLKENEDDLVLAASTEGKTGFQFQLGTTLRLESNKFRPETYGYPELRDDETQRVYTINLESGPYEQVVPQLERYYYELKVADYYQYRDSLSEQYVVLKGAGDLEERLDVRNKLNYGVANTYAQEDPFKYANVYLRETYFLEKPESPREERKIQDSTRRIYYAVLDRIETHQRARVGELGLEISDTLRGLDESNSYNLVMWRVQDAQGIIKAQGKTVSSVRASTFALENKNYELYRRLNSKEDDGALGGNTSLPYDAPKTLRIYTQLNTHEYLFEDALSGNAANMGINFLGLANADEFKEGLPASDGTIKYNYNLFIDTAYINRGTGPIKPQYLIAVDVQDVDERTVTGVDLCNNPVEVKIPAYKRGRYLINATDSARLLGSNGAYTYPKRDDRYIAYTSYDRLAFVDAIHVDDRLYIVSELQKRGIPETYLVEEDGKIYVDGNELRRVTEGMGRNPFNSLRYGVYYDFEEWSNYHNDVTFSLRFVKPEAENANVLTGEGGSDNKTKQFLIESETTNRNPYGNRKIAPVQGGWVELDNSVPVLSRGSYADAIQHAEIFNVEIATGIATANEKVASAASSVKVVSGIDELGILNAEGKRVVVTNLLGQKLLNGILNSDNVTLSIPKGIVIVSVEGEKAVRAIVK